MNIALPESGLVAVRPAWLREQDAAIYAGVAPRTLSKLRSVGGGPIYAKLGRSIRYAVADLEAWLRAGRRTSTSDPGTA